VSIDPKSPALSVDLFGGRGEVRVWNLLSDAAGPFTAVLSCMLSPGGSVGLHRQEQFPELVIGLEGDGVATVDGKALPLRPGDVVYLPLGSVLGITNRSHEAALSYLIVKASGAPAT
jgi:quercetin dioxygenase-like cupin family protein